MKKPMAVFVVLFLITVVFVVLFLPVPGWPAQRRAIAQINRNCDAPFALTMPETKLQNTDTFEKRPGFGCYILENNDISFILSGYPDILFSKYHITEYKIKSSKYTLVGLHVGCSLDTAREVMKQYGYTLNDHIYKKNGVIISISSRDNVVTSFNVPVKKSSILNVTF